MLCNLFLLVTMYNNGCTQSKKSFKSNFMFSSINLCSDIESCFREVFQVLLSHIKDKLINLKNKYKKHY